MKTVEFIFEYLVGILLGCALGIFISMTIASAKDVLIENAVLKERLKNQPSNEKYIEQILDDLELVIELQQHYYQENITSHSFGDWLQINYPALYERVLNYY